MESVTNLSMPHWAQIILVVAALAGAVTVLVAFAKRLWGWFRAINHLADKINRIFFELTANGGSGSVKERLTQCAADSRSALDLGKRLDDTVTAERLERRQDHEAINRHVDAVQRHADARADAIEKNLARYILHEARNDLGGSKLAEEQEQLLADKFSSSPPE